MLFMKMFTGIIEATAPIHQRTEHQLVINRPAQFEDIVIGASISISGVCLSIAAFDDSVLTFDVVEETWSKSKLGALQEGDLVNLERAVRADGRLDGHVVQGHVEGVGKVIALSPDPSPVAGEGSFNERVIRRLGMCKYPPKSVVSNARTMRKKPTEAEEKLWKAIRRKNLNGLYFRRQRPVGRFILDFYCEECRLGIELDGSIHDSAEERQYDEEREEHLYARGVRILRFSNDDVFCRFAEVLKEISDAAEQSSPLPAGGGVRGGGCLHIEVPKELSKFCVQKGSITLDGVSLTIASVAGSTISVALVPHTLTHTTLGTLDHGDLVNIETDIIGRYLYAFTRS